MIVTVRIHTMSLCLKQLPDMGSEGRLWHCSAELEVEFIPKRLM